LEPLWLWRVCGVEAAAWYGLEIVAGCRLGLRGAMNRINAAQGFAFTQFFPFSVSFTLWVRRPPYFFWKWAYAVPNVGGCLGTIAHVLHERKM